MGPPGAVLYLDGGVVLAPQQNRPFLVGYTTFISTANIGGRLTANTRCDAEFAGSHLCNQSEFRVARSTLPLPAAAAWLDFPQSATSLDPDFGSPCNNFTFATGGTYTVPIALPNGSTTSNTSATPNCSSTLPLACCTMALPVRLRGYTTFMSTGNIGGRLVASTHCAAEFPGSHFCNQTEFRVARSTLPLAAAGAWLDFPQSATTLDNDFGSPCNNYTFATGGTYTVPIALPNGTTTSNTSATPNCSSTLPLACCE
jgi:hypothetical protein